MTSVVNYNPMYQKDLYRLYCKFHKLKYNICSTSDMQECIPSACTSKIKLLKINSKIKGYIIYKPVFFGINEGIINVDEIFIEKENANSRNYIMLLDSIKRRIFNRRYAYARISFRKDTNLNLELISMLGLTMEKKQYEMKINLIRPIGAYENDSLQYIPFKKGVDEIKRVRIQNLIFKDTRGHIDCNVDDILREQNQDYYMEDGATFLYVNNNLAGYSQIILEKDIIDKPYIVNFGLEQCYRNLGLSKFLLNHTLHTLKQKGFKEAYITVDADNKRAYGLYKKAGFQRTDTLTSYLYRFI